MYYCSCISLIVFTNAVLSLSDAGSLEPRKQNQNRGQRDGMGATCIHNLMIVLSTP